MNYSFYKVWSY